MDNNGNATLADAPITADDISPSEHRYYVNMWGDMTKQEIADALNDINQQTED